MTSLTLQPQFEARPLHLWMCSCPVNGFEDDERDFVPPLKIPICHNVNAAIVTQSNAARATPKAKAYSTSCEVKLGFFALSVSAVSKSIILKICESSVHEN